MTVMSQAKAILEFWFGRPNQPGYCKPQQLWFSKKPEIYREIQTRFLEFY
jgi:uncharacterized protein (DUF924 family)